METLGQQIRQERTLRRLSLEEMALTTRIPLRILQCIEEDRFDALPGEVFVRGFLRSYADAIGIDGKELLQRYDVHRRQPEDAAPTLPPAELTQRGRRLGQWRLGQTRFGVAIAFAMLMILFTLAISIVMRPQQSIVPVELSEHRISTHQHSLPV